MLLEHERELVVEYGKKMSADRLTTGTSGNISIYDPETGYMAISPSGMNYFETKPEDIVVADLNANIIEGDRVPSSEWALHTNFYLHKPEARAVVHTHSMYCTTYAVLQQPIRAVHYVIADANTAEIPCTPYVTYGTQELAKLAVETAGESNAVLLGNHGMVACGKDLKEAYGLALECEYLAELQWRASCAGMPNVISNEEMEKVLVKFQSYGQKK